MWSWGSWMSGIWAPNQKTRIWLGSYSMPEATTWAYNVALLCLKDYTTNLNFLLQYNPNLDNIIMSPKSIQHVVVVVAVAATSAMASSPSSSNDRFCLATEEAGNEYNNVQLEERMESWYNFGALKYTAKLNGELYFDLTSSQRITHTMMTVLTFACGASVYKYYIDMYILINLFNLIIYWMIFSLFLEDWQQIINLSGRSNWSWRGRWSKEMSSHWWSFWGKGRNGRICEKTLPLGRTRHTPPRWNLDFLIDERFS